MHLFSTRVKNISVVNGGIKLTLKVNHIDVVYGCINLSFLAVQFMAFLITLEVDNISVVNGCIKSLLF